MKSIFGYELKESSACGVGFVLNRKGLASHQIIQKSLSALCCVEHRGACAADNITGDGSGIMTDIPFELLGYKKGTVAVAMLFITNKSELQRKFLQVFEDTFNFWGMDILEYRKVPIDSNVLGKQARDTLPDIVQAIIKRPEHCNTESSFDKLLYYARRTTMTKQKKITENPEFFYASMSVKTIVYKALTRSEDLAKFYLDLQNPAYQSRFSMFHRRFSTNTVSSWDRAQPARLIGHNGEINTIASNRSWAHSREKTMGLPRNELVTINGISDSGSLNEMAEALMYRSSLPNIEDALALMIPPAGDDNSYYKFWGRAMEPWDGPALVAFSDGQTVGARLDRNGFRPCRWSYTKEEFYLSSEAGSFIVDESQIIAKGTLNAGCNVKVNISNGKIDFKDPSNSKKNKGVNFDARLIHLGYKEPKNKDFDLDKKYVFNYSEEEYKKIILYMIENGKEPIGSMGETARLAIFSDQIRSFFDFFFQNFAQVTNPPLDYLREKMITNLSVFLGQKANVFAKKELIPPPPALELSSPLLSLGQMEHICNLNRDYIKVKKIDITFNKKYGVVDFKSKLKKIGEDIVLKVRKGASIVVFSDRNADFENISMPILLVLSEAILALNKAGLRLKVSIVIESAQIITTHHLATTIGFGASAICPYLPLEIARYDNSKSLQKFSAKQKELNLLKAMESGLLKVMSKLGISVLRSYQSSKLFTIIGLGNDLSNKYFKSVPSLLGGYEIDDIVKLLIKESKFAEKAFQDKKLIHNYQLREFPKGTKGEKHSMTAPRSKIIHRLVKDTNVNLQSMWLYDEYLKSGEVDEPINIRHLLYLKKSDEVLPLSQVESIESILKTFGSGAMSFGAISAESQRDIFRAMGEIGGRSNSGEGGENPYYYTEGITASIKQLASGRFGVNARYLITGDEIQIKVAQGAKPGEGGQLMAPKVNKDIAKARHSMTNVDLISPPPLHDIYSIEDLKQLIYELKQVKPNVKVNVKLVSGANIGTIAVGVAKAGADIIHISGFDGGTGAATISSMKHAGLPFEFGLLEVHNSLMENNLRDNVVLRADGGLHTGKDVVMAAIMGAEGFDFGKLLLVAQGCVMARVCEKNTCPTGIATHDPKFKAKYKGTKDDIIQMLTFLAGDIRRHLALVNIKSLKDIVGRTDLLELNPNHIDLVNKRNLDFSFVLENENIYQRKSSSNNNIALGKLNQQILEDTKLDIEKNKKIKLKYSIDTYDRAVLSTLSGFIAEIEHSSHLNNLGIKTKYKMNPYTKSILLEFKGSAGQGFAAFLVDNISVNLYGEANDSVCKSMSGGKVVICPPKEANFNPEDNVIIGNCALYGATGGTIFIQGIAGDRFAVRNSGATAVVEGAGLHACEYMTNGTVVILGKAEQNIGSGMTGGKIYLYGSQKNKINNEYIVEEDFDKADEKELKKLLESHLKETSSNVAEKIIADWKTQKNKFFKYVPLKLARKLKA